MSQIRLANSLGDRPGMPIPWWGRSLNSGRNCSRSGSNCWSVCQEWIASHSFNVRTKRSAMPFDSCQSSPVNVPVIRGNNAPAIRGNDAPLFQGMRIVKVRLRKRMLKNFSAHLHLLQQIFPAFGTETGAADDNHFRPVQEPIQPGATSEPVL